MKISACTITKNEEKNIERSILSYKDYVDEIIVVDTGSTDDTINIAQKAGAKVLKFDWVDDFAAAKNFALDNSNGDWIVFLDADEWFEEDTAKNLKRVIENTIKEGYLSSACKMVNFANDKEIMEVGTTTRIFKKDDNLRFLRPIHETLFDIKKHEPLAALFSDLYVINHSGYRTDVLKEKSSRNQVLLNKIYARGDAEPIDYFYVMRENKDLNTDITYHLFRTIMATPNYKDKVKKFNLGSNWGELMVKISNTLNNEYSFEQRMDILKNMQKENPGNPLFKFYEYIMLNEYDEESAIECLKEAISLDTQFEKLHPGQCNSFYSQKGRAFTILGEYYLFINDKIKALECFTEAIKTDKDNYAALLGALAVIGEEKADDIVLFFNSLYDIQDKDVMKFLVDALRLTPYHDVFLYYFVKLNKLGEEPNQSFFTSQLVTKRFDEVISKYIDVYNESKEEKAMMFVSAALIAKDSKEKYIEIAKDITMPFSRILNSYFNNEKLKSVTEKDLTIFVNIFNEISHAVSYQIIEKFLYIFEEVKVKIAYEVINTYFNMYSYNLAEEWCRKYLDKIEEQDFVAFANYILMQIYYRRNDFNSLPNALDIVVKNGFLNQKTAILCKILNADDDNLSEYYELTDAFTRIKRQRTLEKFEDEKSDSIKFVSIDSFLTEMKKNGISLIDSVSKQFFDFAEKAFYLKAYTIAERYYKTALKKGYNISMCYFRLGYIYNFYNKPELSFYCYEHAFFENLTFATQIVTNDSKNSRYVYSKRKEKIIEKCPICGTDGYLKFVYTHFDNETLTYNDSPISKYMYCDKCNHIFAGNDIEEKIFPYSPKKLNEGKIKISYEVLETIENKTAGKLLFNAEGDAEFEAVSKNLGYSVNDILDKKQYDIVYAADSIEHSDDIKSKIEEYNKLLNKGGILLLVIFDIESAFSVLNEKKPLWANPGIMNAFSRNSIEKILKSSGFKNKKIAVSESDKGKIIVVSEKQ